MVLLRLASALALASLALSARAALLTFTDRAAFDLAAGSGLATVDFESLQAYSTYDTLSSANAPIAPGVTFTASPSGPDSLFVDVEASLALFPSYLSGVLIADLAPSVTAVGTRVISLDGSPVPVTVRSSDGDASFVVTSAFFGVIGTQGTTVGRLRVGPTYPFVVGVDDFSFGTAVPEPASLAALGLGAAALLRRRKRA